MPRVPLEPFVPWPTSLRWAVHDAYFQSGGTTPWDSGDVPWRWTSCFPAARQIERFVVDHLAANAPATGPLRIVELGCGNGAFVHQFFRALACDRRATARAVADRIVYHLTDATPTIPDAISRGFLAAEAGRGRLVSGAFDVGRGGLTDGRGAPVDGPTDVVIANYVVCATPTEVWRYEDNRWYERYAQVGVTDPEGREVDALRALAIAGDLPGDAVDVAFRWEPADPHARHSPAVAATLTALAARHGAMTTSLPAAFYDAMAQLDPGLILVSDFGHDAADAVRGARDCAPVSYGRSLAHPVDFPTLDAWADTTGRTSRRTTDGRAVKVAAVGRSDPKPFDRAFRTADGSRFLDLAHGAGMLDRLGEPQRAVTLYELAHALDPKDPELIQRLGEAMVRSGRPADALRLLRRGARLDDRWDFDLSIGLAHLALGEHEASVVAFRRSCERFDTAEAATRLGNAYEGLQMTDHAQACYVHALERDPGFMPAKRFLAGLRGASETAPVD